MRKNILFLIIPICLLFSCKSDSKSYNAVVKDAAEHIEAKNESKIMNSESSPNQDTIENIKPFEKENEEESTPSEKGELVEIETQENVTPQKPTKPKKTPKSKVGIITFDNYVYEYGAITEGDIIEHEFHFTNTGDGLINVKNATATCGCTRPSYPFIPIAPGERGFIGVTYNSVGKSGVQTPIITVISNAKEKVMKLKLTGEVLERKKEIIERIDSTSLPE